VFGTRDIDAREIVVREIRERERERSFLPFEPKTQMSA